MWIDPHKTGVYLGQCAQYCGVPHAKMLLRVYVQSQAKFDEWIRQQQQSATFSGAVLQGRTAFEASPCLDCHTVRGIAGNGRFGPDLTHLMNRYTIASGAAPNTPENLRKSIGDPGSLKPGATMPDTANYRFRVLKPLAEKLGIERLNFQILRRTMATQAQKMGSVKDIQADLRHGRPDTTADEYMQELPESVQEIVGSMYAMLKKGGNPKKGVKRLLPNATNAPDEQSASC